MMHSPAITDIPRSKVYVVAMVAFVGVRGAEGCTEGWPLLIQRLGICI